MLRTAGILTVGAQSLVDENTLKQAEGITPDQLALAHRERIGLLLSITNAEQQVPIE